MIILKKQKIASVKNKITDILIKYGVNLDDAQITADILIDGDLRSYHNHGTNRIFQIISGFENKVINPKTRLKSLKKTSSIAVFDGMQSLGYPVATKAIKLAIEKAKKQGIGIVGINNTSHIGILGHYSEIAAQNNMIGLVMTTSSPAVVLPNTGKKIWGTNPISYSFPLNGSKISVADFSTSTVARGTIIQYLENNKKLPICWAVDKNGKPTTSPQKALEGGIQTLDGQIKGSLLSLLVSLLSGPMIGGVTNEKVSGTRYMNQFPNKSDIFFAFSLEHFSSIQHFKKQLSSFFENIKESNSNFRIPGEESLSNRKKMRKTNQVYIPKKVSDFLYEKN